MKLIFNKKSDLFFITLFNWNFVKNSDDIEFIIYSNYIEFEQRLFN